MVQALVILFCYCVQAQETTLELALLHKQPRAMQTLIFRNLPTESLNASQAWHYIKYFDILSENKGYDCDDQRFIEKLAHQAYSKVHQPYFIQDYYKIFPLLALYTLAKISEKTDNAVAAGLLEAKVGIFSPIEAKRMNFIKEAQEPIKFSERTGVSSLELTGILLQLVFEKIIWQLENQQYYRLSRRELSGYMFKLRNTCDRFWLLHNRYDIEKVRDKINARRAQDHNLGPLKKEKRTIEHCVIL